MGFSGAPPLNGVLVTLPLLAKSLAAGAAKPPPSPQNSLLIGSLDDLDEIGGLQGRAADEAAVHVGLSQY